MINVKGYHVIRGDHIYMYMYKNINIGRFVHIHVKYHIGRFVHVHVKYHIGRFVRSRMAISSKYFLMATGTVNVNKL